MPHLLDNLRHGAEARTADGVKVGELHAVVVDPQDNQVTHIVVNAGPFFPEPGFGAPELIEVPIDEVEGAEEEQVLLKLGADRFYGLPEYVERAYTPAPLTDEGDRAQPGNLIWSVGMAIARALASIGGVAVPRETFRKAQFERHILNDAPVWRRNPHTHIGDVERVLMDEDTDEIRALVIKRGGLFPDERILAVEYVTEIQDGVVHAEISDEDLRRLQRFPPEPR
jgi:sporulation protein YlmC with PRC-barrel domain